MRIEYPIIILVIQILEKLMSHIHRCLVYFIPHRSYNLSLELFSPSIPMHSMRGIEYIEILGQMSFQQGIIEKVKGEVYKVCGDVDVT